MLRSTILAASRNHAIERVVTTAPVSRSVVRRFVGGADTGAAVDAARSLIGAGLTVTLDHLGEDTTDIDQARAVVDAYVELLGALERAELTERLGPLTARSEVSVKLSAIGQALPGDGEKIALEHARRICAEAERVGATVTLDMEDHTTTDSTLGILHELRPDFRTPPRSCRPTSAGRCRTVVTSRWQAAGSDSARVRIASRPRSLSRSATRWICRTCDA